MTPSRIFFVHRMKSAGVFTDRALINALEPTHAIYNSWHMGYNQDWSPAELDAIIDSTWNNDAKVYLHQHHLNVTARQIQEAYNRGWFLITFVRNPADVICSMHYWCRESTLNGHGNHVFQRPDPLGLWGFPKFWTHCIDHHMRRWWRVPEMRELFNVCDTFSNQRLLDLMVRLELPHMIPAERMNVSSNPGIVHLMTAGTLTPELLSLLTSTNEYQEYERIFNPASQIPTETENATEAVRSLNEEDCSATCIQEAASPAEGL